MISVVISNLLSNAIKYTNQFGLIEVTHEKKGKNLVVSVNDSGIGMTDETESKLFNIDSVYSTEGTNKEKGTGIGLILCKEFIDYHNGEISFDSKVGVGTTFWFSIPLNH